MNILLGGDSATPKPTEVHGKQVWGVYVAGATFHVWTKEEVAALKEGGVEGVLPIVVPPQNEDWWLQNSGYAVLEALVREAIAWGVPKGSPLCLDIEEGQSSRFGGGAADIARAWAVACRTHELIPWAYGAASFLDRDLWSNKWLAEWPNEIPAEPVVPEGYRGWQYAGNTNGIDLDVFRANEIFLSPDLTPVTLHEPGYVETESIETTPDNEPATSGQAEPVTLPGATVDTSSVPPSPPVETPLEKWATWIAEQLSGEGFTLAECQAAVAQYLAGDTVTNPGLAQNLWSMIFSTGTVDPQYVPPLSPVPEVKGSNPALFAQLAAALAAGDMVTANAIKVQLGIPVTVNEQIQAHAAAIVSLLSTQAAPSGAPKS